MVGEWHRRGYCPKCKTPPRIVRNNVYGCWTESCLVCGFSARLSKYDGQSFDWPSALMRRVRPFPWLFTGRWEMKPPTP